VVDIELLKLVVVLEEPILADSAFGSASVAATMNASASYLAATQKTR
jgi:hypothetical protein